MQRWSYKSNQVDSRYSITYTRVQCNWHATYLYHDLNRQNFPGIFANIKSELQCKTINQKRRDGWYDSASTIFIYGYRAQLRGLDLDSEGKLSRLLIVNPTSVQMIRTWPYIVLIDATYKTNKQKWPLCEIIGMTPTNHNFLVAFCLMWDDAAV